MAYHLLGVRKCQLTRVPIPMQFRIILQGPFSSYIYKDGIQEVYPNNEVTINCIGQTSVQDCEMNLVLSDTYPIDLEKQCPKALNRKTLSISRFHGNFTRIHDRKFVECVLNKVRRLPSSVKVVHVFATLNPWNTYEIVNEVFKTGGRDSIECLYVYYQSSEDDRPFTTAERISLR